MTQTGSGANPPYQWNAQFYDSNHAFVSKLGASLIELLAPEAGEHILDLGCGTGHLTNQIARCGAEVTGVDSSIAMIEQARKNYPTLRFEPGDAAQLHFIDCFEAVFSNAVLHWVKPPEQAVTKIWQALKPNGRFVTEFGGRGNIGAIVTAIAQAWQTAGYATKPIANLWYFPSIGEYSSLLEQQGFEVSLATLFDRPTLLESGDQGMQNWIKMFASSLFEGIPAAVESEILAEIDRQLRPKLYQNGVWYADYRRLRIIARKPN